MMLTGCGGGDPDQKPAASSQVTSDSALFEDPYVWQEVAPEEVGFDAVRLEEAADIALADGTFGQAFIVVKDGKIIFEKYRGITELEAQFAATNLPNALWSVTDFKDRYGERGAEDIATSWSVGKSITSMLTGIAIGQNLIGSRDETVGLYLQEWASDGRSSITFDNLLDMRSGLFPLCYDRETGEIVECGPEAPVAGGNLEFSGDQLSGCISRSMPIEGAFYQWYTNGSYPYSEKAFVYSNCDPMVLGEVIARRQPKHLNDWATDNLFSKIGMNAQWWTDNTESRHVLSYCCVDATPRDFARIGQLIIQKGKYLDQNVVPESYINEIIEASLSDDRFYDSLFWFLRVPNSNSKFISALGYDGQLISVNVEERLVVVRSSLYYPIINNGSDRVMYLLRDAPSESNWIGTLPAALGIPTLTAFNPVQVLEQVMRAKSSD